jgi:Tfp pilus assembly major pilin PilA
MFCTKCGAQNSNDAAFCLSCGTSISGDATIQQGHSTGSSIISAREAVMSDGIPSGIKGWSWGAFFLNWVWAIGNRTWWGLLAVIPYVGFIVAVWLGFKGREMAWKNRKWDSVEHFNRVQKKWSQWGVGLVIGIGLIGILAAIAIPAYQDYVKRAKAVNQTSKLIPSASSISEPSKTHPIENIATKINDEVWEARLQATAEEVNKGLPKTLDKATRMESSVVGPGRKFTYLYTMVNLSRESINDSQMEKFSKIIKNRACTMKELEEFFINKTVVGYRYNDMDGKLIQQIDVHPSDCGH